MTGRERSIGRVCTWCGRPVVASRVDAVHCSKRCRQAAHRASIRRVAIATAGRPRRLAYADPPYPGTAARYYREHPDYGGEVDHDELVARLSTYDGWALSTSARALPAVLARCVAGGHDVRVAVWVRGARGHATAPLVNAWEPVIYKPARSLRVAEDLTDVFERTPRRRPTLPSAVVGMKPPTFALWVFQLLGATSGDTLDDLFPGSGIVGRCWRQYQGEPHPAPATRDPSSPGDASPAAATDASWRSASQPSSGSGHDASPRARADASYLEATRP